MQNMNPQQRLVLIGIGIVLIFALLGIVLRGGSDTSSRLEITAVETESQPDTFIPRPVSTFTLSNELDEGAIITARIFPETPHTLSVDGTTVTLTPTTDLFDGTPYEVTLFHTENPNKDRVSIGIHQFRTPEFTQRRDFLRSLPKTFDGYTVAWISELVIYVLVEDGAAEREEEILEMLAENGITPDRYDIDIDDASIESQDQGLIVH